MTSEGKNMIEGKREMGKCRSKRKGKINAKKGGGYTGKKKITRGKNVTLKRGQLANFFFTTLVLYIMYSMF